jgi:hypothetical protein
MHVVGRGALPRLRSSARCSAALRVGFRVSPSGTRISKREAWAACSRPDAATLAARHRADDHREVLARQARRFDAPAPQGRYKRRGGFGQRDVNGRPAQGSCNSV